MRGELLLPGGCKGLDHRWRRHFALDHARGERSFGSVGGGGRGVDGVLGGFGGGLPGGLVDT